MRLSPQRRYRGALVSYRDQRTKRKRTPRTPAPRARGLGDPKKGQCRGQFSEAENGPWTKKKKPRVREV